MQSLSRSLALNRAHGRPSELEGRAATELSPLFSSPQRASPGRSRKSEQRSALAFVADAEVNKSAEVPVVIAAGPLRQDRPLPLRALQLGLAAQNVLAGPFPLPGAGEKEERRRREKKRTTGKGGKKRNGVSLQAASVRPACSFSPFRLTEVFFPFFPSAAVVRPRHRRRRPPSSSTKKNDNRTTSEPSRSSSASSACSPRTQRPG